MSQLKRPVVDICKVRISALDVFPKSELASVRSRVNMILGDSRLTESQSGSSTTLIYTWEIKDRKSFFELLSNPRDFPNAGLSSEILENGVEKLVINAVIPDWLPFFTLSISANLFSAYHKGIDPMTFGSFIIPITHPLRLFIQSLGGLIARSTTMRPGIPMMTSVCGVASDEYIEGLPSEIITRPEPIPTAVYRTIDKKQNSAYERISPFPIDLEQEGIIQQRSVVQAASNLIALYGFSDQLGFYGQRTPYVIFLSNDKSLFDGPFFDLDGLVAPSSSAPVWPGVSTLVITAIVALNGWLQATKERISKLETDASRWRSESVSESDKSARLSEIVGFGIEAASVSSDLGLTRRLFASSLHVWSEREFKGPQELPVVGMGVLNYLATDTVSLMDSLWNNVSQLRDETDWLIKQLSTQISQDSNRSSLDLIREMSKSSRWLFRLTLVLITLTAVIAVLTYLLAFH